jgi:hypothetical protein
MQHAGVQHEYGNIQVELVDQVRDDNVLGTQARCLCDRRKIGRRALQQRLCFSQFGFEIGAGLRMKIGPTTLLS